MKKIITVFLIVMLILGTTTTAVLAKDNKGFDENGINLNARIYQSYVMPEVFSVQKWSKDWTFPMDPSDPVGAYLKINTTWYSDEMPSMTNGFGMAALATYREGNYQITETVKIMKVSDDIDQWEAYLSDGLLEFFLKNPDGTATYLQYPSGAPMYVVIQDRLTITDTNTGEIVFTADAVGAVVKGVGQPLY